MIDGAARGPRWARPRAAADADTGYVSSGGAVAALEAGGFRAARMLAERDGIAFAEGVKGNL